MNQSRKTPCAEVTSEPETEAEGNPTHIIMWRSRSMRCPPGMRADFRFQVHSKGAHARAQRRKERGESRIPNPESRPPNPGPRCRVYRIARRTIPRHAAGFIPEFTRRSFDGGSRSLPAGLSVAGPFIPDTPPPLRPCVPNTPPPLRPFLPSSHRPSVFYRLVSRSRFPPLSICIICAICGWASCPLLTPFPNSVPPHFHCL
jgi:hypothetical protein